MRRTVATFWVGVVPVLRKSLLALLAVAVVFVAAPVYADPATYNGYPVVSVNVNGKPLQSDVPPIIMDGRTLVPLRAAAEALGATVGYDASTSTVSVNGGGAEDLKRQLQQAPKIVAKAEYIAMVEKDVKVALDSLQGYSDAVDLYWHGQTTAQALLDLTNKKRNLAQAQVNLHIITNPPWDALNVRLYAVQMFDALRLSYDEMIVNLTAADGQTKVQSLNAAREAVVRALESGKLYRTTIDQWMQTP